jgi:hypothetical protein
MAAADEAKSSATAIFVPCIYEREREREEVNLLVTWKGSKRRKAAIFGRPEGAAA